jgi:hypothetical protein
MADAFDELIRLTQGTTVAFQTACARVALCPALGGRVFAELGKRFVHRVDLATVAHPENPFNNFGGNNLWPAPEGGKFAFNYRGNEWYVQPCINSLPFEAVHAGPSAATIRKEVTLRNRAGVAVHTAMKRNLCIQAPPAWLAKYPAQRTLSYLIQDSLVVLNEIRVEDALIAAWTLEQFDATPDTVSFCVVEEPRRAINFDFYEPPVERITYHRGGFTYRTDGQSRGQIGVSVAAHPRFIGFYDLSVGLLCIRENRSVGNGIYFNIADNDQPQGPYSAADAYSIFNSGSEMRAFELETVGAAQTAQGILKESGLASATSFLAFSDPAEIESFLREHLGRED